MGNRFAGRATGQRPNLIAGEPITPEPAATDPVVRIVVLTLLAVDGVFSAVAGALLLPFYIGSIPFPVSALISGLLNAALVWAATSWTQSSLVAAWPLFTWLVTVAVMALGGPGDDRILTGRGVLVYSGLLLIVLGTVPPGWVLWRRRVASSTGDAEQRSNVG